MQWLKDVPDDTGITIYEAMHKLGYTRREVATGIRMLSILHKPIGQRIRKKGQKGQVPYVWREEDVIPLFKEWGEKYRNKQTKR